MDEGLRRCVDLLKENEEDVRCDAQRVLLTLCQNILSCPEEKKFREVRLDDCTVIEKLLPAAGAMECLFDVGFTEAADHLVLPQEMSLSKLETLQTFLVVDSSTKRFPNVSGACNLMPATGTKEEKKFLASIVESFERVMRYEDPILQQKARQLIPIIDLEIATMSRIRELQRRIKTDQANIKDNKQEQCSENDIDTKGLFLAELLHWFKHKFFTWVDSPRCPVCYGKCSYDRIVLSKHPNCSRIELHKCSDCDVLVKFPRYSDPDPLLTLRRGRCGEWATVFTLFCRSLGYDARLIFDKTDHVWTEVWSITENRWIHLDPCENVMDRPLMYEKGWGKALTYIIAYSKDEVQDVTWRYTQDQTAVMKRRNICSESTLLQFIESLNKQHQFSVNYNANRREYVIKRRLLELGELLYMPGTQNSDDSESYKGRSSGSYAWKLARGEITKESLGTNYSWDISKYGRTFRLHYSIVKDTYKVLGDNNEIIEQKVDWREGTSSVKGGIFRKVEDDWNMVYLARSSGATNGQIKWRFEVANPSLCVWVFDLHASGTVFHGANVSWEVEAMLDSDANKSKKLLLPIHDCNNYHTDELRGARTLILTATMSGGEGDIAWQHAQLFRQSLENDENPSMIVSIQLNDR